MSKLKINDLELYQTENVDVHQVQGGFTSSFFYRYSYLILTPYPVHQTQDKEKVYSVEPKSKTDNYQLTVSTPEGNSFAYTSVGKLGTTHYATSLSSSSVY
ncbi:MAG: hypothetical protein QNJ49_03955 [Mastigocoleus sp. MO_167.B18]|nr:hypothetical protein [Mastigocoleus sp. MO_167.B18]